MLCKKAQIKSVSAGNAHSVVLSNKGKSKNKKIKKIKNKKIKKIIKKYKNIKI